MSKKLKVEFDPNVMDYRLLIHDVEGIDEFIDDLMEILAYERHKLGRLPPCPFCGNKPRISQGGNATCKNFFYVHCDGCDRSIPANYATLQEAADEWNRRMNNV